MSTEFYSACAINKYFIFKDSSCQFNSLIKISEPMKLQTNDFSAELEMNQEYLNRNITIDLSIPAINNEFYLCAFSFGNVFDSRKINYTTCGEESLTLDPPDFKIERNFT